MTRWYDAEEQHIVVVTAGKLYRTRNGSTALVERMHNIGWSYNGERREHPIWLGVIVDTGKRWSWEFWGSVSPRHFVHFDGLGFVAAPDDLDLIDELGK